jgi:glucose-1-phosphate thymidylyltransferase
MHVIILAAGYGTRLYPLTENIPKSLLTVGTRTILDRIMDLLAPLLSIKSIQIVSNEKFYGQFHAWCEHYSKNHFNSKKIVVLNDGTTCDKERLGPISDIVLALKNINFDDDLLILGGDNAFSLDPEKLKVVREKRNTNILGVHTFDTAAQVAGKFGVAILNQDNWLLEFEEKPQKPRSTFAATAIYLIRGEDIHHILDLHNAFHGGEVNLGELIKYFLRMKLPIQCLDIPVWFDIGTKADLDIAHAYYLKMDR